MPTEAEIKAAADKADADKKAAEEKEAAKAAEKARAAAKKIELTEDELAGRVQGAVDEALRKAAEKTAADAKKAEAQREADEAKKRGDFEAMAEAADKKREAAEAERDALKKQQHKRDVKDMIDAHIRDNHKSYALSDVAKYILPQIESDCGTDPTEVTKKVKAATDQYVKDNPRNDKGGGAPAPPPRTGNRQTQPVGENSGASRGVARNRF